MTNSMSFTAFIGVTTNEGWRHRVEKSGHPYLVRTVGTVESDRVSFTPHDICAEMLEPGGDPPWVVDSITPDSGPLELLGRLVQLNVDDLAYTTNAIQGNLQRALDLAEAELELIHEAIGRMVCSAHAPSERAIHAAVEPRHQDITARADAKAKKREGTQS